MVFIPIPTGKFRQNNILIVTRGQASLVGNFTHSFGRKAFLNSEWKYLQCFIFKGSACPL